MESTFPPVFWTAQVIIAFCMFIHTQPAIQMNACANCNQALRIFKAQLRVNCVCEMLWPGVVLSFNIYVLFFFLWTKDWISGKHSFFFLCVCNGWRWMSVCSLLLERKSVGVFFFVGWFYCLCLIWYICRNYIKVDFICKPKVLIFVPFFGHVVQFTYITLLLAMCKITNKSISVHFSAGWKKKERNEETSIRIH